VSLLLDILAWALFAAGGAVYVLMVLRGVWRRFFREPILLHGLGLAAALAAVILSPCWWTWATLVLVALGMAGFAFYTLVLLRNPGGLAVGEGDLLPSFHLQDDEEHTRSFQDLAGRNGLYLVICRGAWCVSCMAELLQLRDAYDAFAALGLDIAVVSTDPTVLSKMMKEEKGLPFPILSDPDLELIDALGLRHPRGRAGKDIAHPAALLADSSGTVRWTFQGLTVQERASFDTVLEAIADRIRGAT